MRSTQSPCEVYGRSIWGLYEVYIRSLWNVHMKSMTSLYQVHQKLFKNSSRNSQDPVKISIGLFKIYGLPFEEHNKSETLCCNTIHEQLLFQRIMYSWEALTVKLVIVQLENLVFVKNIDFLFCIICHHASSFLQNTLRFKNETAVSASKCQFSH